MKSHIAQKIIQELLLYKNYTINFLIMNEELIFQNIDLKNLLKILF